MPLLDHFHPPLSQRRHWQSFHSAWANALREQLNDDLLPPRYFAEVQVTIGSHVEIDVGTFEEALAATAAENGGVAVWAPPLPTQTATLNFTHPDLFEVQIFNDEEGPRLVAAVELISPANKDRPSHRHVFAVKCASYLQQGISVMMVDIVTGRTANLHSEMLRLLDVAHDMPSSSLYAGAYRTLPGQDGVRLDSWLEPLQLGKALPTLPLWISRELCLPLNLEQAYDATCTSSRLP